MAVTIRVKPVAVSVAAALSLGGQSSRLHAAQVHFPDIGLPVLDSVGYLRFAGEPVIGEAETVAPDSAPDHPR